MRAPLISQGKNPPSQRAAEKERNIFTLRRAKEGEGSVRARGKREARGGESVVPSTQGEKEVLWARGTSEGTFQRESLLFPNQGRPPICFLLGMGKEGRKVMRNEEDSIGCLRFGGSLSP